MRVDIFEPTLALTPPDSDGGSRSLSGLTLTYCGKAGLGLIVHPGAHGIEIQPQALRI